MEYVQMTLDDWMETKRKLDGVFLDIKKNFVKAGYYLRKMDDQKGYERAGYKSVAEFAAEAYKLSASSASRFMDINREYSVDGYSEMLRPEFEDFSRSQLEEMLKLPDNDRRMIQPEAHREDIRQLKRFNREAPETGAADDILGLVGRFYEDNPDVLKEVAKSPGFGEENIRQFAEIVNPGGNRSYKKGLFFLMMYENRVVIKKFGEEPKDMTWYEFYLLTKDVAGQAAESMEKEGASRERGFAPAQKTEETKGEKPGDNAGRAETDIGTETEYADTKKEAAAASAGEQEALEVRRETAETEAANTRRREMAAGDARGQEAEARREVPEEAAASREEQIQGQAELTRDFPEYCPEGMEDTCRETVKRAYPTRLSYMSAKESGEAAAYMAEAMGRKMRNISYRILTEAEFWEGFFNQEVDGEGREIECA